MVQILTRLATLLEYPQRRYVENAITALRRRDHDAAQQVLNSVEFWGGPGSVWDVRSVDSETNRCLDLSLAELLDEMKRLSIVSEPVWNRRATLPAKGKSTPS